MPGTGKTAFAEQVAESLDVELTSRSASGLLDKYVGETEKAIAAMFAEARAEGSVLLLDEEDNFLRARSGGQQRWETTQTNELLVQMERFEGELLLFGSSDFPDWDAVLRYLRPRCTATP